MRSASRGLASARWIPAATVLVAVAALVAGAGSHPAFAQPPVSAILEFDSPPPDFVYQAGDPISFTLKVQTTSSGPVVTGAGFSAQEYWRRLYFTDPLGRIVINAAEASIHSERQPSQCLSRGLVLQETAIPVVPVEVLEGTAATPPLEPFYREYTVTNAGRFFDLSQPGHYQVKAVIPLQVFTVAGDLINDCDQTQAQMVVNVGDGTSAQSFFIESNILEFVVVNTVPPAAPGPVTVQPVDTATGGTPVTVTFSDVTAPGATSLTTGGSGPAPPANFSLGNPPVFYDITTTAGYTPPVAVCVHWVQGTFGSDAAEAGLRFFHFENEAWTDVTTPPAPGLPNPNTVANQICGSVTTLSPFAAFAQTSQSGGGGGPANRPPTASAGPARTVVVGTAVTLAGSARDPDRQPGPLTFHWSQTSGPPVTLSSTTIARPRFTPTAVGVHGFSLTASDGNATSAPSSTTVTARYTYRATLPRVRTLTVGSAIPVAFTLVDARRVVMGNAVAQARLVKPPATTPAVTVTVPFTGGLYQTSLPTAGLSAGSWRLDIVLDDGTTHSVPIRLR